MAVTSHGCDFMRSVTSHGCDFMHSLTSHGCDFTRLCDFMRSVTSCGCVTSRGSSVVAVSLPRDIPVSTTVSLQGGGGLVNQLRRSYSLSDLSSDKDSIPDLGRTRALTDTPEDEVDDGSMPTAHGLSDQTQPKTVDSN
uniref:Uncharacterized protein n=1 Tax=Timema douglasi TaxID=61478 RepID=A0A7R8VR37_TIMDO|nr:unnamed protein product [Timema douglasi]